MGDGGKRYTSTCIMDWGYDGSSASTKYPNWYRPPTQSLYNDLDRNKSLPHPSMAYMNDCSRVRSDYCGVPLHQTSYTRKSDMNMMKNGRNNTRMSKQILSETTSFRDQSQLIYGTPPKSLYNPPWFRTPNPDMCGPQSHEAACLPNYPREGDADSTNRRYEGKGKNDEDTKGKTTMMLRNIPNKYTQKMLLEHLEVNGFGGTYDFFYLPIDFRNRCNVGYAFINFVAPEHAKRFLNTLNRAKLPAYNSSKVCEVTFAHVQGLEQNIEHYRNSPVNGVPIAAYRPLIFKSGIEVGFPKPDAPLPLIQLRPAKC